MSADQGEDKPAGFLRRVRFSTLCDHMTGLGHHIRCAAGSTSCSNMPHILLYPEPTCTARLRSWLTSPNRRQRPERRPKRASPQDPATARSPPSADSAACRSGQLPARYAAGGRRWCT